MHSSSTSGLRPPHNSGVFAGRVEGPGFPVAKLDETDFARLRYRRQFIFGPRRVSIEGAWQSHQIGDRVLTVHQDLPFHAALAADGSRLILLGFWIDPEYPDLSNEALLLRIAECSSWEQILPATVNLSGRWVLLQIGPRGVRVVNDATGLRSVFFSVAGQEPWCFSQPGLYRRVHPVQYSPEGIEFMHSKQCQKDFEACWPAASSPYREVAHLLANHYLDLETRRVTRFWPTTPLEPMELGAAVLELVQILQKSMQAVSARGPTAFALTAGRDSRTLLAASRAVADRLWVHTAIHGELNLASPDIRIPSAICRAVNLTHHAVPCPQSMTQPFKDVFMNNHDPAYPVLGRLCQGLFPNYPPGMLCVRGNVSETGRCSYYPSGVHPASVQAQDLARLCHMPPSGFVHRHFDAWLEGAIPVTQLGYKLLDLFHMEHRITNWLGVCQTQHDIVHDTFSPYSNRRLLSAMWVTPASARIKPHYTIYRELIGTMWPELLAFPLNPRNNRIARLLHKARKARGQIGALVGWRPVQVRLKRRGPKPDPNPTLANQSSRRSKTGLTGYS